MPVVPQTQVKMVLVPVAVVVAQVPLVPQVHQPRALQVVRAPLTLFRLALLKLMLAAAVLVLLLVTPLALVVLVEVARVLLVQQAQQASVRQAQRTPARAAAVVVPVASDRMTAALAARALS